MRFAIIGALLSAALATPVLAQEAGDAAAGEKEFRKCKACHMIQSPEGEDVVKGGAVGPNLYGVMGRPAGSQEGYNYSDALIALKDSGEVWTPEDLAAYITDPNKFVQEKTGDSSARTKMTFKLNKGQADIAAYLASASPAAQ
ncbi:cytochrome C [Paracoccus sediminis]|uniref:Cytochrome C n=1 Tax=Paracoccus sediminis TaxID=1214787 RepID=A0A238URZ5_9RHOB|nr:cytochrome C [Paracoccus sediminis]TBN52919.1 cytochrome C [Paracoccus sediminis]SNR24437.1 cytochrome c [Paracoccus sediminis]